MTWILIFWMLIDRGGGPATAEFASKERCEEAAQAIFATPKYKYTGWVGGASPPMIGNYVCVRK